MTRSFIAADDVDDARRRAGRRRPPRRRRHRPRRRRPLGQVAAAREHRRDPPHRRAPGVERARDGGLRLGALASHAEIVASDGRPRPLHRARRRLRDRRLPRDARAGHDRRQPDERLAGHGDGRPARLLRRDGDAPVAARSRASCAVDDLWTGPGADDRASRRAARRGRRPRPAAGTGSAYLRLEYRRQMEIAVVGATRRRHGRGRHGRPTRGSR